MQEVSGKDALGEWTGYNDPRVAVQGAVAMEVWEGGCWKGLNE